MKRAKNIKISREELFSLLSMFMEGFPGRWERCNTFISIYTTIILSIFGATVVGITSFTGHHLLYLLISPALNISIIIYAKKTIKKQGKEIKEYIAMIAKIQFQLGLYENFNEHIPLNGKYLWIDDDSFILPRWVRGRMDSGKTSEEFIRKFGIGGLRHSLHMFNIFIIINVLFILFILIEVYITVLFNRNII